MNFLNRILGCSSGCVKLDEMNLTDLMERNVIILDVRTPGEYASGHIAEARNTPLQSISNYITDIKKENRPVITYCRSGKRSEVARTILHAQGIEVYNGGGIGEFAPQWEEAKTVKA